MNSIVDYIKSFTSVKEVSTLREDLGVLRTELSDMTLPPYRDAKLFGSRYRFKHNWCASREKEYNQIMGNAHDRRLSMVEMITRTMETLPKRVDWLYDKVDQLDSKHVARDGVTYPVVMLIRLSEVFGYMSRYSRKLLLCLYAYETDEVLNAKGEFPYSNAELVKIEEEFKTFVKLLRTITEHNSREMESLFESIPDVTVDVSGDDVTFSSRANPMQLGFIPYTWNPIYHIRIAIAEFQADRYEAARLEKQSLELRLLQLKQAQNGQGDAAVENTISQVEDRLQALNYKLAKTEEKYG